MPRWPGADLEQGMATPVPVRANKRDARVIQMHAVCVGHNIWPDPAHATGILVGVQMP